MNPIRRLQALFRAYPLRTMAIWLALIVTVFLTRNRWEAWVDSEELPELAGSLIRVSADRTRAIFRFKDRMELWDLRACRQLAAYDGECPFSECGFTPDGSKACLIPGHRGPSDSRIVSTPFVVDAGKGQVLFELTASGRLTGARLSSDGAWIVLVGEDGSARVHSSESGGLLLTLEGSFGSWPRVWVSPDGSRVFSDPLDRKPAVWDVGSARSISVPAAPDDINDAGFTGDGELVLVCPDGSRHEKHFIVSAATGREKSLFDKPVRALMISENLGLVAAVVRGPRATHTVEVRKTEGDLVRSFEAPRPGPDLYFESSGRLLFHGELSKWGELWDLSSGARVVKWPCSGSISPSGTRLFLKDIDEDALQVFRASSRRVVASIPRADSCAVIDDETVIAGTYGEPGRIVRRIRPEQWWGVSYLWHFWVIVVLGLALALSIWKDARDFPRAQAG